MDRVNHMRLDIEALNGGFQIRLFDEHGRQEAMAWDFTIANALVNLGLSIGGRIK